MPFFARVAFLLTLVLTQTGTAQDRVKLRVALFPYLPAPETKQGEPLKTTNEAMRQRLEREFEKLHEDVDLELRPFNENEDFYDPLFVGNLLRGTARKDVLQGEDPYDLVEVDTVILGALLDIEAISPWSATSLEKDFNKIALEASRVDGQVFGIPHWLCGHFIITLNPEIARAGTVGDLVSALANADPKLRNITGNLLGSWYTAAIYFDAWADSNPGSPQSVLGATLDEGVLRSIAVFARQGEFEGTNPLTDKKYKDNTKAAHEFGSGQADAMVGYSERLFYALSSTDPSKPVPVDPAKVFLSSAPLGKGTRPLWFVDSLVLRAPVAAETEDALAKKRSAALRFAQYLNSPRTFAWIHMSEDLGGGQPHRYLIPATNSAWETAQFASDPVMKQIRPMVAQGDYFPRFQFAGVRRSIGERVKAAWSTPVPQTTK